MTDPKETKETSEKTPGVIAPASFTFSFAQSAKTGDDPKPTAAPVFSFGGPQQGAAPVFSFSGDSSTPASSSAPASEPGPTKPSADDDNPEKDECTVHFEPKVLLKEVKTITNEENEKVLFKIRSKLFRFDKEGKQWKERGTGDVKFLQDNDSQKVRILMRRERTHKVCVNHLLLPSMKLEENCGSDRSWVWSCSADYAETPPTEEVFAIRFANSENAQKFKDHFIKYQEANGKILQELPEEEKKE